MELLEGRVDFTVPCEQKKEAQGLVLKSPVGNPANDETPAADLQPCPAVDLHDGIVNGTQVHGMMKDKEARWWMKDVG